MIGTDVEAPARAPRFRALINGPLRAVGAVRAFVQPFMASVRSWVARLSLSLSPLRTAARPYLEKAGAELRVVSGLGWTVLVAAVVFAVLGAKLGWREFSYLAAVLAFLLVGSAFFAIGRTKLEVIFEVAPARIEVGDAAAVRFGVTNRGLVPLLPLGLEFPVGESKAQFTLPPLAGGASFEDVAVIPGTRRSVVQLGPVKTQRGDPFGVVRREVVWTERTELFVHPKTIPLEPLGAGLLRDLEGRTTQDISMSDLAFHTLREYQPGDDRRYIHWRSSAKYSGASGSDRFLVRQFLDTRRSHIAVVVDVLPASYVDDEEFELAMSLGASIAVRAMADEMDLTLICGEHTAVQPVPHLALDTYSRAVLDEQWDLPTSTGRLNHLAPDASVAILITGSACDFSQFHRAKAFLAQEVSTLAMQVRVGDPVSLREAFGLTVVHLGRLGDLPRVLSGGQLV